MSGVLTKNGDSLELDLSKCRGSVFEDAKEKIREIPGRRFDWDTKKWIVPATPQVAERVLKTIQPEADPSIHDWVRAERTQETEHLTTQLPDDATLQLEWADARCEWQPEEVNDEKFTGLFPWQRAAVDHLVVHERAILADDMGLGKTLQALSAIEEWVLRNGHQQGPKLVVAPSSVKGSWKREIERWLPPGTPVHVISGTTPQARHNQLVEAIADGGYVIVNWEQLRIKKEKRKLRNGGNKTVTVMKEPLFEETEWLAVVADEVHRAKNRKSQQAQGLWRVQGKIMYGLSGTPLMNSPDELWSILRWLWPDEYGRSTPKQPRTAYWAFYNDFVEYWEDTYGRKVVTGVKNPDALRFALKEKIVRRTAELLGLEGRKRIRYALPLNAKQQRLYDTVVNEMWIAVEEAMEKGDQSAVQFAKAALSGAGPVELYRIPNGAARMVRLQQVIETPALLGGEDDSALMDDAVEKFEDSRPEPWVFGCKFKDTCTLLKQRLEAKGAVVGLYTGDVDPATRTELEDRFQRGEVDAIVGTIAALKEGITLTRARLMYQFTEDMVPAVNEQFESRCDRLGQQRQVLVYKPQGEGTIAAGRVRVINRTKEKIVLSVVQKHEIKEEHR